MLSRMKNANASRTPEPAPIGEGGKLRDSQSGRRDLPVISELDQHGGVGVHTCGEDKAAVRLVHLPLSAVVYPIEIPSCPCPNFFSTS